MTEEQKTKLKQLIVESQEFLRLANGLIEDLNKPSVLSSFASVLSSFVPRHNVNWEYEENHKKRSYKKVR